MNDASFRFYAELNDFLPETFKRQRFQHLFRGQPGIKDVIEALGPPHTEVDLIIVNESPVAFEYRLQHKDRVSVFPRFRNLDITSLTNVRPPALDTTRFVLDMHLGRLAAYLRMLGFDSLYWNQTKDAHLAHISHDQHRILLTRDRGLLKRTSVIYGYCVRSTNPREQLVEIARRFQLTQEIRPFRRCMRCNGILEQVDKKEIIDRLPEGVQESQDEFRICPDCQRVYWRGSHFSRMERLVRSVFESGSQTTGNHVD